MRALAVFLVLVALGGAIVCGVLADAVNAVVADAARSVLAGF